jgi:hypothetical protein
MIVVFDIYPWVFFIFKKKLKLYFYPSDKGVLTLFFFFHHVRVQVYPKKKYLKNYIYIYIYIYKYIFWYLDG